MGKLTFIAGMAAGYVLGARAGRQRYEQIRRTSGKVWNSGPVQKQVFNVKEVARTKAAPVVADMVADAARSTGEKLRSSRTVEAEAIETVTTPGPAPPAAPSSAWPVPRAAEPSSRAPRLMKPGAATPPGSAAGRLAPGTSRSTSRSCKGPTG